MSGRWKIAGCLVLCWALAGSAGAQNILLKDGKTIVSKGLRRQGDTIMATVENTLPASGTEPAKVVTGEIGYKISTISKLDFPEPAQLQTVPELIATGKMAEALVQIEPVVRYYGGFRDAPGSWWVDAVLLKIEALHAMGNFKEADPLIDNLARTVSEPDAIRSAKVFLAAQSTRRGDHARALKLFEEVLKDTTKPATLAMVAVNMGHSHLALKQYDSALLSFLQIPVFYPRQRMLLPQSLLGTARAYFGLENLDLAKATLAELLKDHAASPQVPEAKAELAKIAQREKDLAPPK